MIGFLTTSPVAFIGAFVVVSLLLGAGIDWVRKQQVRDRQKVPAPDFGKTFFAENEEVANRVRQVLGAHLSIEAEVIRADDRLDDDLDVDIGANPDLFFELEEAFDIDCRVDDFEVFEETTARLVTVSDVVAYVVEKVAEARTKPARPKKQEARIDGADIVAFGWFLGLIVMVVGGVMQHQRSMAIGLVLAFGPLTVGLGRILIDVFRDFVQDVREMGLRELLRHPFAMIGWLIMVGLFVFVFGAFCFLLWNAFFGKLDFG